MKMSAPWLYNAEPNDTEVVLPKVGTRQSVSGENLRAIDAKSLGGSGDLIIRYAPKLESITGMSDIQDAGVSIRFEELINPEIKLDILVSDLIIPDNANQQHIRIRNHSSTTYLCSHELYLPVSKEGLVIHYPNPALKELRLYGSCKRLLIMGSVNLEKITLSGDGIIERIDLKNSPNLLEIDIRQRVNIASVEGCFNLKSIKGFGDDLRLDKRSRTSRLEIGGFWLKVPRWYGDRLVSMRIDHFEARVSMADLETCEDMGGIIIEELAPGITIDKLVRAIINNEILEFESWTSHCVSRFDEYIAMRILVALSMRGYNEPKILLARLTLSKLNREAPILPTESVNRNMELNYSAPYTIRPKQKKMHNFPEWYAPLNSVMPFCRLDLEIYLNTMYSDFWLDFNLKNKSSVPYNRTMVYGDPRTRQMMESVFACSTKERPEGRSKERLKSLVKDIYLDDYLANNPHCCEFLIHHLGRANIKTEDVLKTLLRNILRAEFEDWTKRALVAALIFKTNYSPARTAMMRLKSQGKIGLAESKMCQAIAIAGQRAFVPGKMENYGWPYLEEWVIRIN